MSVYGWFGTIIFWAAGFRISIKGKQAPRSEAPILVGAPHSSFLEALIIYMCGSSPVSRHENKTAFLISACQIFYQAIFVDRLVMHLQLWTFAYIRLLNKPYENVVTLREQKVPSRYCQPLDFLYNFLKGLDILLL